MVQQKIAEFISTWLTQKLHESGCKGLVVGVSGGVDSALTSTLCALTGQPVRAYSMPIHQKESEVDRAQAHLAWLSANYPNVTADVLDLTQAFDAFKSGLTAVEPDELALANTRSRLRMAALYAASGTYRMLVCGTGNRVEDFGIGFFTKYGDGGVDVSPIAGLMKTEVYQLAAHLGVCDKILQASPTDGLWEDGRSDEEQIGATYAEIEWAMLYDVSESSAPLSERQQEVLQLYNRFNQNNSHKLSPVPICIIPEELKPLISETES
ncbi:MAG: NAD(+) synthase [Gammaproteobacteria bacterium]